MRIKIATPSEHWNLGHTRHAGYRLARLLQLPTVALLGLIAVLTLPMTTSAATDPYPSGQTGYDLSYTQCGGATPAGVFGVIGVNGGRPFKNNACLAAEYAAAPATSIAPSLYINTGYSGAYGRNVTSSCAALSDSVSGSSSQRKAWAIGCSEADTSLRYASSQQIQTVAVWWLDVETANSWSTSDLSLNRYAIQGAVDRIGQAGSSGIYSTSAMWTRITGGNFSPIGTAADWVVSAAGGSCSTPFTSPADPVWLVQSTASGFDSDLAC